MKLRLAGGWGYNNLGDEAILAGYLESLHADFKVTVHSVDPIRTARAQLIETRTVPEDWLPLGSRTSKSPFLVAGGGYLNGTWKREIYLKLARLNATRNRSPGIVHAIELRAIQGPILTRLTRNLMVDASVSVRDTASAQVMNRVCNSAPQIVPDAIALLAPTIGKYCDNDLGTGGMYLVNLLDITGRSDKGEAELDTANWREDCLQLVAKFRGRAVGLIVGGGDYRFMRSIPDLPLIAPTSVSELVTAIAQSRGLISVRMHPALLGTMLNVPTLAVPYCGKVRPTLAHVGVESAIIRDFDPLVIVDQLAAASGEDYTSAWSIAAQQARRFIESELAAICQDV